MSTTFLSRYRRVALNPMPLQLLLADELLDVHVLEGDHPDPGDEAGRPVHVPHPGVVQGDVEVGVAVLVSHLEVELVGQVEAALGLDDVLEHPQHVPVLLVELQLHVGLVALEILGAHWRSSSPPVGSYAPAVLIGHSPSSWSFSTAWSFRTAG